MGYKSSEFLQYPRDSGAQKPTADQRRNASDLKPSFRSSPKDKHWHVRQEEEILKQREADILMNQNFTYEVKVSKPTKIDLSGTGQYVTNCLECSFTCHPTLMMKTNVAALLWITVAIRIKQGVRFVLVAAPGGGTSIVPIVMRSVKR